MHEKIRKLNDESNTLTNPLEQQRKYEEAQQDDDELNQLHDRLLSTKKTLCELNLATQTTYIRLQ